MQPLSANFSIAFVRLLPTMGLTVSLPWLPLPPYFSMSVKSTSSLTGKASLSYLGTSLCR